MVVEGRTEERKMGRQTVSWGQRGDRESLFEATGCGGRGGGGGGGVDGGGGRAYRGLFLVLRPVQSRGFACWPTDEITTTSKIAGDRRRVHRAKYDLECGSRVERREGNGEGERARERESFGYDRTPVPFIRQRTVAGLDGNGWIDEG